MDGDLPVLVVVVAVAVEGVEVSVHNNSPSSRKPAEEVEGVEVAEEAEVEVETVHLNTERFFSIHRIHRNCL